MYKLLIVVLALAASTAGCGGGGSPTPPPAEPPTLTDLQVNTVFYKDGDSFVAYCSTELNFHATVVSSVDYECSWSVECGNPTSASGEDFIWTAPEEARDCTITVTATNSAGSATHTWQAHIISEDTTYTISGNIYDSLQGGLVLSDVEIDFGDTSIIVKNGHYEITSKPIISIFSASADTYHYYKNTIVLVNNIDMDLYLIRCTAFDFQDEYIFSDTATSIAKYNDDFYVNCNGISRFDNTLELLDSFSSVDLDIFCQDPDNRFWGIISEEGKIVRLDSDGNIDLEYADMLSETAKPYIHWGIAVNDDFIYATDINENKLLQFNESNGSLIKCITSADGIDFNKPCYLVIGPDGNLYMSDFINSRIVVFDNNLDYLYSFNIDVDGEKYYSAPLVMSFGGDGNLYIHDRANACIKEVTTTGELLEYVADNDYWGLAYISDYINGMYIDNDTIFLTNGYTSVFSLKINHLDPSLSKVILKYKRLSSCIDKKLRIESLRLIMLN